MVYGPTFLVHLVIQDAGTMATPKLLAAALISTGLNALIQARA